MSRVTNVHLPEALRDERDEPAGVQGMTRHSLKFSHWDTLRVYDGIEREYPWNDANMRWDPDRYIEPQNKFGYRSGEDPSPEVQQRAPGGMFGQLHAGASTGVELRTLPVRPQYNTNL